MDSKKPIGDIHGKRGVGYSLFTLVPLKEGPQVSQIRSRQVFDQAWQNSERRGHFK